MATGTIVKMYVYCFLVLSLAIFFLFLFIKGRMTPKAKEAKKVLYPMYGFIAVFMIIGIILVVIPPIMDIPYVITHNYSSVAGIVTRSDGYGGVTIRTFDTGDEIDLELNTRGIPMGSHLTINYLPFSKNGTVIDGFSFGSSE